MKKNSSAKRSAVRLRQAARAGRCWMTTEDYPSLGICSGDILIYNKREPKSGDLALVQRTAAGGGGMQPILFMGYEPATDEGSVETGDAWMRRGETYIVEWDGQSNDYLMCDGTAFEVSHVVIPEVAIIPLDLGFDRPDADETPVCKILLDAARVFAELTSHIGPRAIPAELPAASAVEYTMRLIAA